jgi:hypothetical protein
MMNLSREQKNTKETENTIIIFFVLLGLMFIGLAFLYNTLSEICGGYIKIITSPANLITDYIELTNVGATLMNAGIMLLVSLVMIKANGAKINGILIAALFTVTGFSLFGKNIYNSFPITLGVLLYAKLECVPFKRYLPQALFGTSLGPLVSEVSFSIGFPTWQGVILGVIVGIFVGFLIPPLSISFSRFHQGFNLYNIGFTAGIIGMFFMAILHSMGIQVQIVSIISSGNNKNFGIILYLFFVSVFLFGLFLNGWNLRGFNKLLNMSGRSGTDFIEMSGYGLTMINMALLGCLSTTYVLVIGGELNGPTIGGILTVVGFGAYGKHIKNVIPIIIGVFIAKLLNVYDIYSTSAILALLFGTTLAPIAGHYGIICGIIAGFIHMAVTMNIGYLHGGMNLYNNGFSGGFIAAALVPFFDSIIKIISTRRIKKI